MILSRHLSHYAVSAGAGYNTITPRHGLFCVQLRGRGGALADNYALCRPGLQNHEWSVFRKKNIMQGLFEWKWGFSFKSLICGRKKKDGLQCEKSKWFLDRISIPGCEYSRRQPEPDEWSPLPASTPPRGQTRGHWSLTPDSTTFSWLEDRLSVWTLMYTSIFDIHNHRHT